jgi:hypothetical protein
MGKHELVSTQLRSPPYSLILSFFEDVTLG